MKQRLIDAFLRGEVTLGGLAEAGWFVVGEMVDGGPVFVSDSLVSEVDA